jgi:hypothetical protein
MTIMLSGVCIEKTRGGNIISFLFFVIDVCIEKICRGDIISFHISILIFVIVVGVIVYY